LAEQWHRYAQLPMSRYKGYWSRIWI